jgi:hypothetical protein
MLEGRESGSRGDGGSVAWVMQGVAWRGKRRSDGATKGARRRRSFHGKRWGPVHGRDTRATAGGRAGRTAWFEHGDPRLAAVGRAVWSGGERGKNAQLLGRGCSRRGPAGGRARGIIPEREGTVKQKRNYIIWILPNSGEVWWRIRWDVPLMAFLPSYAMPPLRTNRGRRRFFAGMSL